MVAKAKVSSGELQRRTFFRVIMIQRLLDDVTGLCSGIEIEFVSDPLPCAFKERNWFA